MENSYPKMNPTVKQKWIDALRSGNFQQTVMRLKGRDGFSNNIKYCCWGVLTELYHQETGNGCWDKDTSLSMSFVDGNESDSCVPTKSVYAWAGVDSSRTDNTSVIGTLVGMNDNKRNNFNEIADWIEENL